MVLLQRLEAIVNWVRSKMSSHTLIVEEHFIYGENAAIMIELFLVSVKHIQKDGGLKYGEVSYTTETALGFLQIRGFKNNKALYSVLLNPSRSKLMFNQAEEFNLFCDHFEKLMLKDNLDIQLTKKEEVKQKTIIRKI